jgi:hypothetical protein
MVVYVALVCESTDVSTMRAAPETLEELKIWTEMFFLQRMNNFTYAYITRDNDWVLLASEE